MFIERKYIIEQIIYDRKESIEWLDYAVINEKK